MVDLDDDTPVDLVKYLERIDAAIAEAGYPDAHVYFEATGIFVDGAPEPVVERAFEVSDR